MPNEFEHYDRIAAMAADVVVGLRRDKTAKTARMPTGDNRSKAVYVPDADRQRKALRLVEECSEYFCPPPPQLLEALRLAFLDSERDPIGVKSIDEEATIRLLAGQANIAPKSWRAFRAAAAAEAQAAVLIQDEVKLSATVYAVARAAGADRKSVAHWRTNPEYIRTVREYMGK